MTTQPRKSVPSETLDAFKWPKPAQDARSDMGLAQFLACLQLLAKDEDRERAATDKSVSKWSGETPASLQVIKSGALAITKTGTKVVAGAGGGAAALSAVLAVIASAVTKAGSPIVICLIASAAFVFSATAVACAIFVKGDLEARGAATAARHAGRSEVTSAFLRATVELPRTTPTQITPSSASIGIQQQVLLALGAFPGAVHFRARNDSNWRLATGTRRHSQYNVQVCDDKGIWTALDEIEDYTTKP
jgi:hypothetical protein